MERRDAVADGPDAAPVERINGTSPFRRPFDDDHAPDYAPPSPRSVFQWPSVYALSTPENWAAEDLAQPAFGRS